MADYFEELNEWIDYVLEHLSSPDKINQYLNHRQEEKTTYSLDPYRCLRIAATVQDPAIDEIYQRGLATIDPNWEEEKNKFKNYYENDIAEISRIVSARNV